MQTDHTPSQRHMNALGLRWMLENHRRELAEAARKGRSHEELLERLLEGEAEAKFQRRIEHRISNARLPVVKTLDQFRWDWPTKVNRDMIRHLARLDFIEQKANIVFIGAVGVGKTHLATAIAYEACRKGHRVLFTTAVDIINKLARPQALSDLPRSLRKYTSPALLVIDELGYLPVDRKGANLLFQVFSERYERGSVIITTNRAYKDWPQTFANDAAITSAVIDRIVHHCETVIIEGRSFRMKDRIEQ